MTSQALLWTAVLGVLQLLDPRVAEGAVTETTVSNRPPFSFACSPQVGGSVPTFCSAASNDKKFIKVDSVEIYRDYSNEVGSCLDPEKFYIADLLNDWFNYDCKTPNIDRDEENKRMPIELLRDAMTKHCGIANAGVARIVVHYECVRTLVNVLSRPPNELRNDTPTILPRPPIAISNLVSTTRPITTSTTSRGSASATPAARTPSVGQPQDAATRSSTGTSGGVIETTAFNQPPFSFACNPMLGDGTSTFCGDTEDIMYMSIERVEIYRDYNNKVGYCLDHEREIIKQVINKWFNYDCKMPVVARGEEIKIMPVSMLKYAMNAHCGTAYPDVSKIEVHYSCVKTVPHFKDGTAWVSRTTPYKTSN